MSEARGRRLDGLGTAALLATLVGLGLLFEGLDRAVPLVFFGTGEERRALEHGRVLVAVAVVVLVMAAIAFLARGRRLIAVMALLPGPACWALAWAFPNAAYAWFAFLVLAPLGAGFALAGAMSGRRSGG